MAQKPTLMILGSAYSANRGKDFINSKMDDVLAPERQRELQQLVEQLARFNPTKITVEIDTSRDVELQAKYHDYLNGSFQLERDEIFQIGFRLAKEMGHPKVHCVDYTRNDDPIISMDFYAFAEENNQTYLLGGIPKNEGKVRKIGNAIWIEQEYEPLIDMYRRLNQDEGISKNICDYLKIAQIGLGDQYPGANWVAHSWYVRNLKIFVNITRITESDGERVLLIIGAGHLGFLKQLVRDSEVYLWESPLAYLEDEGVETS